MNPEDIRVLVAVRLENADESLRDGRVLLDGGGSGRSVVNRAYYAMF